MPFPHACRWQGCETVRPLRVVQCPTSYGSVLLSAPRSIDHRPKRACPTSAVSREHHDLNPEPRESEQQTPDGDRPAPLADALRRPQLEGYTSSCGKYRIRLLQSADMQVVTNIQAEAFHTPIAFSLLDDVAKANFRAEVLDALKNKLQYNPVDSFAIFVATRAEEGPEAPPVAVLEMFIADDPEIMAHIPADSFAPTRSLRRRGYAWLGSMAVMESERRKGCASALLDAAHSVADRLNVGFAALHVFDDNAAGIALYERNGYQCVDIDPAWRATFGFKRRVLMMRQLDVQ